MKILIILATVFYSMSVFSAERIILAKHEAAEIKILLELNEHLHSSFFSYDALKAQNSARKIKQHIDLLSNKKIKKLLRYAVTQLVEIKSSNSRAINNEKMNIYSLALTYIIKKYKITPNYNAFYCPMAQKTWVQQGKVVQNPFKKSMPACGDQITTF